MANQDTGPEGQQPLEEAPQRIRVGVTVSSRDRNSVDARIPLGPTQAQLDEFCLALASSVDVSVVARAFSNYRTLLSASTVAT